MTDCAVWGGKKYIFRAAPLVLLTVKNVSIFPERESLVSDIPAGDGIIDNNSPPGRVWLVTSRLWTRKSTTFFFSVYCPLSLLLVKTQPYLRTRSQCTKYIFFKCIKLGTKVAVGIYYDDRSLALFCARFLKNCYRKFNFSHHIKISKIFTIYR